MVSTCQGGDGPPLGALLSGAVDGTAVVGGVDPLIDKSPFFPRRLRAATNALTGEQKSPSGKPFAPQVRFRFRRGYQKSQQIVKSYYQELLEDFRQNPRRSLFRSEIKAIRF